MQHPPKKERLNLMETYTQIPFPKNRELIIDTVEAARLKNHVSGCIELDVTQGRDCIHQMKTSTGQGVSFTGWMAKCIAQAVSEHKQVHALRYGKRSMIIFDDVDILIMVNRVINNEEIALPYVVRNANEKSVQQIHNEIRTAQAQPAQQNDMVLGKNPWFAGLLPRMPKVVRRAIGRKVMRDPFLIKRMVGTVEITALGMIGNFAGWAFPISPQPLCFALGGIVKRPGVVGDKIVIREYLSMAFMFDHDVVDGAPFTRFLTRLSDLVTNGFGLG